jgi:hypothetical protein
MTSGTASSLPDLGDEVLAVAAAHRLGLTRTEEWPTVAAYLVAAGVEGENTVTLAGLPRTASGWEVDQLVPAMLAETGAPTLTDEQAADVVARLLAHGLRRGGHPVIRTLAALAPQLDYPGGPIGEAYWLVEWLDCECHRDSAERDQADRFEEELRGTPRLRIPRQLAEALAAGAQTPPPAPSHV